MEADKRYSRKEILNYEFSNRYYSEQIRNEHFILNISIDKPVIINIGEAEINNLHHVSELSGSAIVNFQIDKDGKVTGYKFLKRAGLGIDAYIEEIIKKMSFEPLYHQGYSNPAEFNAKFVFFPE